MIQQIPCYTVICDGCNKNAFEESEYAGYGNKYEAFSQAVYENEFKAYRGKHYCYDCAAKYIPFEPDDVEEIEFEPCSNCDGHDACHDFGCAIKAGIIEPKDFLT